ncbi:adenosine deaminase 2-like [Battus philenor]|uniref:adenosine deaminase 2-like n=1 Tax=Battus philenor TaxID=42288 RepID=UPI0035CF4BB7
MMKLFFSFRVLILIRVMIAATSVVDNYYEDRMEMINNELRMQIGGDVVLSEDEALANDILMYWKRKEIDEGFHNPQYFNFSKHYFAYRGDIAKSKVYQIIRKMPKGAVLHIHSSLMLSADQMLDLTYEDHLYICFADELQIQFSSETPQKPCPVNWILLSELRNSSDNVTALDESLKKHFTLLTNYDCKMVNDINQVWNNFEKVISTISQLIKYRPVREKFFYKALKEFYNDNIQYIEIRSGLHSLYELNGTVHDKLFMSRLYRQVTERFKREHPDFVGVKIIVTKNRMKTNDEIWKTINLARQIKEEMPEFFAGFDLVGQEDLGKSLSNFYPVLKEAKNDLKYYFHGGETNWYGTSSDENLFDAVLLGTKRIGHSYGLIKHPSLLIAVKQKDIALEVNVVSNVVLNLVHDVRNHPLASYLALGLPVVLSSDDPGAWGADPMSHDFYITFVGIASKRADLRLLKQLVINSIRYSTLDDIKKTSLLMLFNNKWDIFIQQIISNHSF